MIKQLSMPTEKTPFITVVYSDNSIECFNEFDAIPSTVKTEIEKILLKWVMEICENVKPII